MVNITSKWPIKKIEIRSKQVSNSDKEAQNVPQKKLGQLMGREKPLYEVNSIIFLFQLNLSYLNAYRLVMKAVVILTLLLLHLLLPTLQSTFSLTSAGKNGVKMASITCNIQTTLEFQFSPSTTMTSTGSITGGSASKLFFLTAGGNDVTLQLVAATYENSVVATGFVTGYGSRLTNTVNITQTPTAAFIFQFSDNTNSALATTNVYVYIPVISGASNDSKIKNNPDVIDFTASWINTPISTTSFTTASAINAFNIFDQTNFNLWYTAVVGKDTILVNSFIYNLASTTSATSSPTTSLADAINAINWSSALSSTGDKLCYASTVTTGNFQTHLRESVPLWFIWFGIFIFWLIYLCADSTNSKVYDDHYEDNPWTCTALYSLANLAHEECFTRLSRLTTILINWSIQGVFIASIYGNQFLGSPMIIWTAAVAFAATIPFPFLIGYLIHRKIYEKNLMKYDHMKSMKGMFDKSKIEPHEQAIDTIQEKLYGYYHWFYSLALCIFFICWPIAINQMQKLPRVNYYYHWYWLASMGIAFALEYFIYEPLIALLFSHTRPVRVRGGYFYDFKLGQAYRAAQTY